MPFCLLVDWLLAEWLAERNGLTAELPASNVVVTVEIPVECRYVVASKETHEALVSYRNSVIYILPLWLLVQRFVPQFWTWMVCHLQESHTDS